MVSNMLGHLFDWGAYIARMFVNGFGHLVALRTLPYHRGWSRNPTDQSCPNMSSVLFGDTVVPRMGWDCVLLLGYTILYKEHYLTRFNHQKKALLIWIPSTPPPPKQRWTPHGLLYSLLSCQKACTWSAIFAWVKHLS